MSDVKLTGEFDAKGIVMGANRTKAAMNDLNKSSGNLGRGMLAVSQGFEDFSMAGMKGVLNNIPQAIGMFGGSAGLAAGASIAAVSIYVLTDKIFGLLDAMQEAKLAEFAKSGFIDLTGFEARKKAIEETTKAMSNYVSVASYEMAKKTAETNLIAGNFATLSDSSRALALAEKMLSISNSMLSNEEKTAQIKQASLDSEIAAMDEKVSLAEYAARQAGIEANGRKTAANAARDQLSSDMANQDALKAQIKDQEASIIEDFQRRRKLVMADTSRKLVGGGSPVGSSSQMARESDAEFQARKQREIEAIGKQEVAAVNELQSMYKKTTDQLAAQIALEEVQLKNLDEMAKRSEDERAAKEGELSILRSKIEMDKQTLKLKQDQAAADDLAKRQQEVRNAAKAMMSNDAINSSGLLSSLGRVGGSAREAVSALGAINIQKQQLSTLKIIARNTAKRTVATAG